MREDIKSSGPLSRGGVLVAASNRFSLELLSAHLSRHRRVGPVVGTVGAREQSSGLADLDRALDAAEAKTAFFSDALVHLIEEEYLIGAANGDHQSHEELSAREREIWDSVRGGRTTKEIADELSLNIHRNVSCNRDS